MAEKKEKSRTTQQASATEITARTTRKRKAPPTTLEADRKGETKNKTKTVWAAGETYIWNGKRHAHHEHSKSQP